MDAKFIIPAKEPKSGPYFLAHSIGPMTKRGRYYLDELYLTPWREDGGNAWPRWLDMIERFSGELGNLIGGQAADFCPQQNLSSGLTKYLLSLPCTAPDKPIKILMHGHAFPSMGFVVSALSGAGYELDLIPAQLSTSDLNVWAEYLTEDIDAVLITHVHSNTGALSPVTEIAEAARAKNIRVLVDVAQSVGIMPIDLKAWQADAVFGSCVKWLCGGPGAGWMWVNPATINDLKPIDVGWFSHENPFEFDIRDFRYASSAKRFWGGTPNVAPYALALGGIETISKIGIDNIRAHNLTLLQTICPDRDFTHNGGTLCYDGGDKAASIEAVLHAKGAQFDRRGNVFRLSMHISNTAEHAKMLRETL